MQPANQLIVSLFFTCATQWNYAGMAGVRVGLNYPAVDVRISKIPDYVELPLHLQSDVWQGLAVMERACLTVWSEQSNE
ncbi:DUF1799 domain-containing protein [Rheinheimera baltica]|uniref:DUF1799 domain-containing protein n=1 Tax=Rheinheimera baltica TaxID=67576 RepID=UPI0023E3DF1A|nr:DUF1799 domain-containing protein [Rheinheimera baltica]